MKYYAVIDTNVLVSSMLKRNSLPGKIMDYVVLGKIVPLLNKNILTEYIEVISRNGFGFSNESIEKIKALFNETGIFLERTKTEEIFDDPDDIVFYEIVLTARKIDEAYLITGNKKHFPGKHYVVSPREMLDIIEKNDQSNFNQTI